MKLDRISLTPLIVVLPPLLAPAPSAAAAREPRRGNVDFVRF
jgi:hypothetical protein